MSKSSTKIYRKFASSAAAVALAFGGSMALAQPASALTWIGCAGWADKPSDNPGNHIGFGARMKCAGSAASKTDLYRVRASLMREEINWGPIPNNWYAAKTTAWSASVVKPNTAGVLAIASCSSVSTEGKWLTRGEGQLRDARQAGESSKSPDYCTD